VAVIIGYCSRCGGDVVGDDEVCRCCGAETVDANMVVTLKRVSARRSLRDRNADADAADDNVIPL
jgi:hypothetical protein